jgi:epoxyqueuosine reductase
VDQKNASVENVLALLNLQAWARELGFSQIAVSGVDLTHAEAGLQAWLDAGFAGSMAYMHEHGMKRARPAELVPGTASVITARMDYAPEGAASIEPAWLRLKDPSAAYVSVYARGRDYHKVLRQRLAKLGERMAQALREAGHVDALAFRAFTDSAPVLEAQLATQSGLGWRGKHSLVLNREAGSLFFLGELFVNIALPPTAPVTDHCGSCSACLDVCPTQAIVAPYKVDARRCISYLTIENDGEIPVEFRRAMGNRIYGCDDCQLACPWNKFAQTSPLKDFDERPGVSAASLVQLLAWDEATFLHQTEGSAIRRIGFARWQRNLCVAAGNALAGGALATSKLTGSGSGSAESSLPDTKLDASTAARLRELLANISAQSPSAVVRSHAAWALLPV